MNIPYYLHGLSEMSIDAVTLIFVLVTYYIYCYVKEFKQLASLTDVNVKSCLQFYFELADNYDKITPLFDHLMTAQLLQDVPKLMMMVWAVLLYIKWEMAWFFYASEAVSTIHLFVRLVVPCIIAEMINSQIQSTKLILHQRMLTETVTKKKEIRELLRYMKVRRLEHRLWHVVPLDMRLPLALLSTCLTYLIVIVQFSHLYE